jgi:hypothetical protein
MNYQDYNAETIDRWVDEGWIWGRPISHETFLRALRGECGLHGPRCDCASLSPRAPG